MDRISKLTRGVMAGKSLDRAANAALICHVAKRNLNTFFKKSFLKEVEVVSFRDGILFISTPNSMYSQEIKMKEKEILDKLNLELKNNLVNKIKFRSIKI